MSETFEDRRDRRFHTATLAALKDIHERGLQLPTEQRYPAGYGILRGYVEQNLLVNFAEAFSEQQLAEIRIVLDQLSRLVGEDENINEMVKHQRDHLAQALREAGE